MEQGKSGRVPCILLLLELSLRKPTGQLSLCTRTESMIHGAFQIFTVGTSDARTIKAEKYTRSIHSQDNLIHWLYTRLWSWALGLRTSPCCSHHLFIPHYRRIRALPSRRGSSPYQERARHISSRHVLQADNRQRLWHDGSHPRLRQQSSSRW